MDGGTAVIANSTISGNSATGAFIPAGGGGIAQRGGRLTITNSTLKANKADADGTAFVQGNGTATFSYVTISGSTSTALFAGTTGSMYATAVWNSAGNTCAGSLPSLGYDAASDHSCASFSQPTDQLGHDLKLGPLANNGGPTLMMLPKPGSPLLDVIPNGVAGCGTTVSTDQRGQPRPHNGSCDIGSVEK
jgi:hypothetical protein